MKSGNVYKKMKLDVGLWELIYVKYMRLALKSYLVVCVCQKTAFSLANIIL